MQTAFRSETKPDYISIIGNILVSISGWICADCLFSPETILVQKLVCLSLVGISVLILIPAHTLGYENIFRWSSVFLIITVSNLAINLLCSRLDPHWTQFCLIVVTMVSLSMLRKQDESKPFITCQRKKLARNVLAIVLALWVLLGNFFEMGGISGVVLSQVGPFVLSLLLQTFDEINPILSFAVIYILTRPNGAYATSLVHWATANSFVCCLSLLTAHVVASSLRGVQARSFDEDPELAHGSDSMQ
jgi:hypothetical protein